MSREEKLVELIEAALGRKKADIAVLNANIVNVLTGEIEEGGCAIKSGRIIAVGDVEYTIGPPTKVIDVRGGYICPGFIDAHVHFESSLLTLSEFAIAAVKHGTTSAIIDPHEIANVLGVNGIKLVIEEAKGLPVDIYVMIPSCVPASPNVETSAFRISPDDVIELAEIERVIGLAELMNYPGVLNRDPELLRKIEAVRLNRSRRVDGHAPLLTGSLLNAYMVCGIASDHECVTGEEILEKIRKGMWIIGRKGALSENLSEVFRATRGLDKRRILLATDDIPANVLINGHMDKVIERAIELGVDPVEAIQMATVNPATYFRLDNEIGSIAIGLKADLVVLDNLREIKPKFVISKGEIIKEKDTKYMRKFVYPSWAKKTVRIRGLTEDDLKIRVSRRFKRSTVRVIKALDKSLLTKMEVHELRVSDGVIMPNEDADILSVAVIERHKHTGNIGLGFVHGFSISGAIASTYSHDSHNLIVVGSNTGDMLLAVNKLKETQGGLIAVSNGQVKALLELPIAGLLSEESISATCRKLDLLKKSVREMGCRLSEPFMTLSFLTLSVIPELKITDRGLIHNMKIISPIAELK